MKSAFAICINDAGYKFSLTLHKVYQVLSDLEAEKDGMIRVVDDTGEDYLFGEDRFVVLDLPPKAAESFTKVAT